MVWQQTIEPTLNLLKSYIINGNVSVINTCNAATLIYDIYDMSRAFEHEGQTHNFSIQAESLISNL